MRRRTLTIVVVLGLASLGGLWLAGRGGVGGPSAFAVGPAGWAGAFRYLEAAGAEPVRWQRPLASGNGAGTWALAFPWSAAGVEVDAATVNGLLDEGATLVVGYSGGLRPGAGEQRILEALHVGVRAVTEDPPPLAPVAWWRWVRRDRALAPPEGSAGPRLAVSRARWRPVPPATASIWLVDEAGEPAASAWAVEDGTIILLPAEVLANRRLHHEPHRRLLATIAAAAAPPWRFDEYHHGWSEADVDAASGVAARRAWDRLLLQVALIYLVAAWALARRMGPTWRSPRERTGGSGDFLRRLGRLHAELGHAPRAAVLLLERAAALDPRIRVTDRRREEAARATAADLLRLSRSLGGPGPPRSPSTIREEEAEWTT